MVRSLCARDTRAAEVPYLAMNFRPGLLEENSRAADPVDVVCRPPVRGHAAGGRIVWVPPDQLREQRPQIYGQVSGAAYA